MRRLLWSVSITITLAWACAPGTIEPFPEDQGIESNGPTEQDPPDQEDTENQTEAVIECGDSKIEGNEVCDSDQKPCTVIDSEMFIDGQAPCRNDCSGYDTTDCTKPVTPKQAFETIVVADLEADLTEISSDEYNGRFPGSEGDLKTQEFIINRFTQAGIEPGQAGSFVQEFNWNGRQTANVVGVIKGTDPNLQDEVVVIGAHMDHLGTTSHSGCGKNGGNNICNGADDNGSGTIGVVAAAMALSKLAGQNRRTLVFMTYGAEEKGLIGSRYYVKNDPWYPINKTIYMINLDMIGYSNNGSVEALGARSSDLAASLLREVAPRHGVQPRLTSSGGGGSDHYHFEAVGIPVTFFITGLHACYHKTCDTKDQINFQGLAAIVRTATEFMWEISQSDESPRRDFRSNRTLSQLDVKENWELYQFITGVENYLFDHEGARWIENYPH